MLIAQLRKKNPLGMLIVILKVRYDVLFPAFSAVSLRPNRYISSKSSYL